jgi:hypothetical protein
MDKLALLNHLADQHPGTIAPERFLRLLGIKGKSPTLTNAMWHLFCRTREIPTLEQGEILVKSRRAKPKTPGKLGRVESHFFDSGSFALWTKAAEYHKKHKGGRWDYYETPEFWQYMDAYAEFVKAHPESIDCYANVDVIPNPELSYRNLKYLEGRGIAPVPVVHFRTDLKWLKMYIKNGYEFIALGGLVGSAMKLECKAWLDACFNMICDTPDRKPKVKLHGFGLTAYEPMLRYPWWSVDSTAWAKVGVFGLILVPKKRKGEFVFTERPNSIAVTTESPDRRSLQCSHLLTLPKTERMIVDEWLEMVGVAIGETDQYGERLTYGITNSQPERIIVNLRFFEYMSKTIPEWPWPFNSSITSRGKGLGFV